MTNIITSFITLFIFLSCNSHQEKSNNSSNLNILISKIDSISAENLEKLVQIPIRNKFGETYNGYYSLIKTEKGENILHGKFEFIHFDSSAFYNEYLKEYDYSMISVSKIIYSGSFKNGKKDGEFTESLLFDDGVDFYSNWNASINFKDDNCTKGTFTGILGHIMKKSTYTVGKMDTCTFQFIVDSASKQWEEEWKKSQNNQPH